MMEYQKCDGSLMPAESGNPLDDLFAIQRKFINRFHSDFELNNDDHLERSKIIDKYLTCIIQESAECRDLIAWKDWKTYSSDFKIPLEELRFEIADLMCFLMNLAMAAGMGSTEFFQYTYSKQLLNVKRQEDPTYGYVQKEEEEKEEGKV